MSGYEYEVDCGTCGKTFSVVLGVPAERIEEDSLARFVDALHVGECDGTPAAPDAGVTS